MTGLGLLTGGTFSEGRGINSSNHTTGCADNSQGYVHAFYQNGSTDPFTDLGTMGGNQSEGNGINGNDVIAGWSDLTGSASRHGFWYDSSMHDIGTLGGTNSVAEAINNSNVLAGESQVTSGFWHAFTYTVSTSTFKDLGTLGGNESRA